MQSYKNLVVKASEDWMENDCAADRQLYFWMLNPVDMNKILEKLCNLHHSPSMSAQIAEEMMKDLRGSVLPERITLPPLNLINILGVQVQFGPILMGDHENELFLDISWRPPSTKEDCVVDGQIVDNCLDAVGINNCKMITFCTGGIDVTGPTDPVDSIFAEPFVVLYKSKVV
jgi:hypothetical protein